MVLVLQLGRLDFLEPVGQRRQRRHGEMPRAADRESINPAGCRLGVDCVVLLRKEAMEIFFGGPELDNTIFFTADSDTRLGGSYRSTLIRDHPGIRYLFYIYLYIFI
jgi:hypothetical protein